MAGQPQNISTKCKSLDIKTFIIHCTIYLHVVNPRPLKLNVEGFGLGPDQLGSLIKIIGIRVATVQERIINKSCHPLLFKPAIRVDCVQVLYLPKVPRACVIFSKGDYDIYKLLCIIIV